MAALPASAWPWAGVARVASVLLVVLALGAVMFYTATTRPADPASVQVLAQAEFVPPSGPPRRVALPHTWVADGLANEGRARYVLRFELTALPTRPWALSAQRLSSRHEIRLNGQWVHGDALDARAQRRGVPVPVWVDLAAPLLRIGSNEIDLEVDHDFRAGLSPLRLGPSEALWPWHLREQALSVTVPQALNMLGLGLATFMVAVWWRRRSERALGAFAGLLVLVSVRNLATTGSGTVTHTPGSDVLLFVAQLGSAWLLGWFALAWSGRDWAWFRRSLNAMAAVGSVAALWASVTDGIQPLRVLVYPLLVAALVPSLVLIVIGTRRQSGAASVAIFLSLLMLCLAPIHDYLHLRGLTSVMDRYWMPFVAPVTLLVFAWAVVDQFAAALEAVEGQAAELERRVAQRTAELAGANAAKTRFLAAASHDLRQPVVSISLLGGLLREQPLGDAARQLVARIGDSVSALNAQLKGLLDLSRFDAGVVAPRQEPIELAPLLEAALADEREAARRKGLALRVRGADGLVVLTDALLLEQIVRNLVGNAVRYTDRGGVLLAARSRPGDRLLLQVWDTGRGIPAQRQREVFEEFVQLDADDGRRHGGLGLGLALVWRATQLLGVPLRLRSRVGRGSVFEIELPMAAARPAVAPAPAPAPDASHPLGPVEVWIVDDEQAVREALTLRFEGWGAQVRAFADVGACESALTRDADAPGLVVTDQRLPDGTGLALAALLRAYFGPGLPVLVVTGDTAPQDVALLKSSGLAVLHKPFDATSLRAAVRAMLPPPAG